MLISALGSFLACSVVAQDCPRDQFCSAPLGPGEVCPAAGVCEPLPAAAEIRLQLPIPAGESVFCAKGPLNPLGSHSACSASGRFAYDLATPAFSPPKLVLAAADGVAFVQGGCDSLDLNFQEKESRCNNGWGNFVRIQHSPDLFTQVAHLSAILVRTGDKIKAGQRIGIEGNTGAAGSKHIHFSAHRGQSEKFGPSIPVAKWVVGDKTLAWNEIRCGNWIDNADSKTMGVLTSLTPALAAPTQFGFDSRSDPPIHCPDGFSRLTHHACVSSTSKDRAPLVFYFHGMYQPPDANIASELTRVAKVAGQFGISVISVRGEPGLCNWSSEFKTWHCFPSGAGQLAAAGSLMEKIKAALAEFTRRVAPPRELFALGFSNGGFFTSLLLNDSTPLDAFAIVHGGAAQGLTLTSSLPKPVLLIAAEQDQWQLPATKKLDEMLSKAKWSHELTIRPGGHELTEDDLTKAFSFFAKHTASTSSPRSAKK